MPPGPADGLVPKGLAGGNDGLRTPPLPIRNVLVTRTCVPRPFALGSLPVNHENARQGYSCAFAARAQDAGSHGSLTIP